MPRLTDKIAKFSPCQDAVKWLSRQKSPAQAWKACKRGEWMIWLLWHIHGNTRDTRGGRALWHARASCAELSLPIYQKKYPDDSRVCDCIQAIRDYADGKIALDGLRKARSAAYDAYDDAFADAVDACAACAAAYAVYAFADAADIAAAVCTAAARKQALAKCADIVRKFFPQAPKL